MTDDTTPPRSALATMRPPKARTTAPSLFDELRELDEAMSIEREHWRMRPPCRWPYRLRFGGGRTHGGAP